MAILDQARSFQKSRPRPEDFRSVNFTSAFGIFDLVDRCTKT